jgi:hypothetical protein
MRVGSFTRETPYLILRVPLDNSEQSSLLTRSLISARNRGGVHGRKASEQYGSRYRFLFAGRLLRNAPAGGVLLLYMNSAILLERRSSDIPIFSNAELDLLKCPINDIGAIDLVIRF